MSALEAAETACALADRSILGRLIGTGPDLLGLLQRLSTGDVKDLRPGEGKETVVTNAKGRIVERLFVHHLGQEGVLLIAGPEGAPRVEAHLRKFTFAEQTGLSDVTAATFAFALIGPRWADAARTAGIPELAPNGASAATIAGTRVHAARTNGFDTNGVLVMGPIEAREPIRDALIEATRAAGGVPIDADVLEAWRIGNGFPAFGSELTEDHNPLEAGLRHAVSFTKGCYVGQEVVARLNTYAKVSRALFRLELETGAPVPPQGAAILVDGNPVGAVTSAVLPPGRKRPVALAYLKTRELPEAAKTVGVEVSGTVRGATLIRA